MIPRALRGLLKKKMADSRVRRAAVWLVVLKKAKTSVAITGRYKVIPCTTLICTKAAAIRPAISYFELFKASSLKRGMDTSLFFCVARHCLTSSPDEQWYSKCNSWNIYIHCPTGWWWDISTRHSNAKSCNAKSTTSNSFVPPSADCGISNDWKLVWCISCVCVYLRIKDVCEAIRNNQKPHNLLKRHGTGK